MEELVEDARESFGRAAASLTDQIRSALVDERSGKNALHLAVEQVQQFVHAIDWGEKWIISLVSVEAALFLIVLFTRQRTNFQGILFLVLGALIYCAKYINVYCARNWEIFAKQPYFDEQGLFISAMVSGPLLVINMAIVVNHLIVLSGLIVKAKTAELKYKARERASRGKKKTN